MMNYVSIPNTNRLHIHFIIKDNVTFGKKIQVSLINDRFQAHFFYQFPASNFNDLIQNDSSIVSGNKLRDAKRDCTTENSNHILI